MGSPKSLRWFTASGKDHQIGRLSFPGRATRPLHPHSQPCNGPFSGVIGYNGPSWFGKGSTLSTSITSKCGFRVPRYEIKVPAVSGSVSRDVGFRVITSSGFRVEGSDFRRGRGGGGDGVGGGGERERNPVQDLGFRVS